MKKISPLLSAVFVLSTVSCIKETGIDTLPELSEMQVGTIAARWEESPGSRTEIQPDGTTVMWSGEEHIRVFFSPLSSLLRSEFISPDSGQRKDALFSGSKPTYWGIAEKDGTGQPFFSDIWALYPYGEKASCDGESITFTLPSKQPAKAGSFADNLFPAIGKSPDWDQPIVFYNVCGGACFSVSEEGITSVTFKSVDGEALCGKVRTGFNEEGLPQICEIFEGVDSVVVESRSGFDPGSSYYAVFLPQTLQHGLRIRFRKGKMMAVRELDRSITVNRSRFGRLEELDKGLDYVEDPNAHDPDDIIPFEDPWAEKDCVNAFDFNGDGKLSYGEAATALSIEGVLTHKSEYTSFDELRFFTRIETIPSFSSSNNLKRISLPDGVTSIGDYAFSRCSDLERIAFGENLKTIGYAAFSECYSLKHVHIASLSSWLDLSVEEARLVNSSSVRPPTEYNYTGQPFYASKEGHLYINGEEVTFVEIPCGYRSLRDRAFRNCTSITGIAFPSGFTDIASGNPFGGCTNLKTIAFPSLQDLMKISWEPSYHPLYKSGGNGHLIIAGEEITHLVIPEGTTEIPRAAFLGSGLNEITLPRSLTRINVYAFYLCKQLTKVNIPDLETWINLNDSDPHYYNSTGSPFQSSAEGHLYIDGKEVTSLRIPDGITKIPSSPSFRNCTGITDIIFPEGLQVIDYSAFIGCTSLTDITLPEGMKTIGYDAFEGCTSLKRIHVPSLQTWLGLSFSNGGLFSSSQEGHILLPYDEELREVVIPEQTKSIGSYAFAYCTGLEKIVVESTVPPTLGTGVFLDVTCPIYVWTPCLPVYQAAAGWKDYQHLLTANPNTP